MDYENLAKDLEALREKYPALADAQSITLTRDIICGRPSWRVDTTGGAEVTSAGR